MAFSRSAIYRFCIVFAIFNFLDIFSFIGFSDWSNGIKYLYTAIVVAICLSYLLTWQKLDLSSGGPLIVLFFFLATGTTLIAYYALHGEKASFVSAFVSALVFGAASFVPAKRLPVDSHTISRHLLILLSVGSTLYMVEAIFRSSDIGTQLSSFTPEGSEHVKSAICVLALCMSLLMRRARLSVYLAVVAGVALIARPSSTFAFALVICVALAVLLVLKMIRMARIAATLVLLGAIVAPLLLYLFFDDIGALVQSAESYLKSDLLGGTSNTLFRLAILRHAFARLEGWSLIFGSGFYGDINVNIAADFPYWREVNANGLVPIHSDFVILLVLSGSSGYILFAIMLLTSLQRRLTYYAGLAATASANNVIVSISVISLVVLVIYSSFNPFLSTYQHVHVIWMTLLISELLAKQRGRAAVPMALEVAVSSR
jgi:hypothetical protein